MKPNLEDAVEAELARVHANAVRAVERSTGAKIARCAREIARCAREIAHAQKEARRAQEERRSRIEAIDRTYASHLRRHRSAKI